MLPRENRERLPAKHRSNCEQLFQCGPAKPSATARAQRSLGCRDGSERVGGACKLVAQRRAVRSGARKRELLSRRLEVPRAHDELRRLTETLNATLQRIEASSKRITRFTADVSHDLRTPVAVIRTIAAVTLRRPRSESQYAEARRRGVLPDGLFLRDCLSCRQWSCAEIHAESFAPD